MSTTKSPRITVKYILEQSQTLTAKKFIAFLKTNDIDYKIDFAENKRNYDSEFCNIKVYKGSFYKEILYHNGKAFYKPGVCGCCH